MHSDSKPKKQSKLMKPLQLNKETLRELTDPASQEAVMGGALAPATPHCTYYPCTSFPCDTSYC